MLGNLYLADKHAGLLKDSIILPGQLEPAGALRSLINRT